MKTRSLATIVILIGSFLLAPGVLRAQDNDWYQGRRGRWIQEQNAWRFRDIDGDEYRQQGNSWEWFNPNAARAERAEQDEWYQGRRGHWIQEDNAWRFRDVDGDEYRQEGGGWVWARRGRAAEADQWFQGRRGHWFNSPSGWRFRAADGEMYRAKDNTWQREGRPGREGGYGDNR